MFHCSLQCQININLVFHTSDDGSEIEVDKPSIVTVLQHELYVAACQKCTWKVFAYILCHSTWPPSKGD